MAGAITGLILAGENVTRTGSGTLVDPYVMSAVPAEPGQRSAPVEMPILAPATSVGPVLVTRNPCGSATLAGHVDVAGPLTAGDPLHIADVPAGFGLADSAGLMARGHIVGNSAPIVVGLDFNPGDGGDVFLMPPDVAEGQTLSFILDGVTFWPGA